MNKLHLESEISPCGRYFREVELKSASIARSSRAWDADTSEELIWISYSLESISQDGLSKLICGLEKLSEIRHHSIQSFYAFWIDEKNHSLILIKEKLTPLKFHLKKCIPVLPEVQKWTSEILEGLLYMHRQGLEIRHLTVDTLLLDPSTQRLKLGGFEISHIIDDPFSIPEYTPPEWHWNVMDGLGDVYKLGMCLIEICTLRRPYSECQTSSEIFESIKANKKPLALDAVASESMKDFIGRCLLPYDRRPCASGLAQHSFIRDKLQGPLLVADHLTCSKSTVDTLHGSKVEVCVLLRTNSLCEIKFLYDLEEDTPQEVASEMVQELQFDPSYLMRVAQIISERVEDLCSDSDTSSDEQILPEAL